MLSLRDDRGQQASLNRPQPIITKVARIEGKSEKVRRYDAFRYAARSWHVDATGDRPYRGLIEGYRQPLRRHQHRRRVALALRQLYCARGQAENLIKVAARVTEMVTRIKVALPRFGACGVNFWQGRCLDLLAFQDCRRCPSGSTLPVATRSPRPAMR